MAPPSVDPDDAKAPAPPRSLARGAAARAATELDPDIDPDFPDVVDVDLHGVALEFPAARTITVLRSTLTECHVGADTNAALDAADTAFVDCDLTGRTVESLTRVTLVRCRLGGADFGDARLRDVRFDGCVLDLASLRGAQLERVDLRGGRVDGLDLSGARLLDVTMEVSLAEVTLDGCRIQRVDLTNADLSAVTDVTALRGATISETQALSLSARLARAAGLVVAPR
ncbi:MAG: pentapeptide repeat-containing protein [Acidimicrobiales bacterium]